MLRGYLTICFQITRQICNDKFDEIDVAIHGPEAIGTGRFRKGFFIFLFVTMYLIPMIIIVTTCIKIAICLLKPIVVEASFTGRPGTRRKHEENKRKVREIDDGS